MIESGSSLFYLFHCSTHDRLNTMPFRLFRNTPHGLHQVKYLCVCKTHQLCLSTSRTDCILTVRRHGTKALNFASAHSARIASGDQPRARVEARLCLSTFRTDCIRQTEEVWVSQAPLPQHIPHGLHLPIPFNSDIKHHFASAHSARIASAKLHRCNATNPRNML